MDSPDIISGAITRPQGISHRYFVVENVEAVVKTCYATSRRLRETPTVVVVRERIASKTGIAEFSALLTVHVTA